VYPITRSDLLCSVLPMLIVSPKSQTVTCSASTNPLLLITVAVVDNVFISFVCLVCASLVTCDGENLSLSHSLSISFLSKSQLFSFPYILQVFHGQFFFARPRIWHGYWGQIRDGVGDIWSGYIGDISGIYRGRL